MKKSYNKEEMLYWYSVATALKLVHNLSKAGAAGPAYDAAAKILLDAANDKSSGRDPEARIRGMNGRSELSVSQ